MSFALTPSFPLLRLRLLEDVCYRVAKTHRIPYLYRSFSAKVTYIYFCGPRGASLPRDFQEVELHQKLRGDGCLTPEPLFC